MSKEVTIYGYNSVETSVSKNPDRIIELYVDKSTSNKRIDKLLSSSAVSKLSIKRVDKSFLSDLLSTEKHQGIIQKINHPISIRLSKSGRKGLIRSLAEAENPTAIQ